MSKQIIFNKEAREKLMAGADKLADAVRVTLGAKGRNVMIGEGMHAAFVTNDGVTVARSVELDDPIENIGAYFLKEAASKTEEMAGDGTTTCTILTQSMLKLGMKYLAADANPMSLKRGMHKALERLVEMIDQDSIKISLDGDELRHVATISANNDEFIGGLIAESINKVGKSGIVTVESSSNMDTKVEIVEGTEFDKGYIHSYFMTNADKKIAELYDAYILVTDYKIYSMRDLLPILEKVGRNKPLLIISDEIDSNVVPTIILNHSQGIINVCCVKAPGFGDVRISMLEDIAAITGAEFVSSGKGMKLEDVTLDMLGYAKKVNVSKDKTAIIDGDGDPDIIQSRIKQIEDDLKTEEDSYAKDKLHERLGRLTGGAAVLYVGGATETEMEEKKYRVDDALSATKAALEEGIVPGGGVELVLIADKLLNGDKDYLVSRDEELGADIVLKSLKEPLFQILKNAGLSAEHIFSEICKLADGTGYDLNRNQFVNMVESGVIDPAKVTKAALINATSIASMVLTTEAIISKKPQE
jgi:chaperonin GroEL